MSNEDELKVSSPLDIDEEEEITNGEPELGTMPYKSLSSRESGKSQSQLSHSSPSSAKLLAEHSFLNSKEEQDFINAKAFLLTTSTKTGINV